MTTDIRRGWKVLTHDYRPPVQGGEPVWNGDAATLPYALPAVVLDTSGKECAGGWNYCADLAAALRIAHLWPDGWAAACFAVEASADAVERGDKRRASRLTLVRRATDAEMAAAVAQMSAPFGAHAAAMAAEQLAWYRALGRPERDPAAVETHLQMALAHRSLKGWRLRRYDTAVAAWAARDAWAARAARAARAAVAAWAARDAWAAWAAWAAWDAVAAWAALAVHYAALRGWVAQPPDLLTVGLREAYAAGLALVTPVAPWTLGWALVDGEG